MYQPTASDQHQPVVKRIEGFIIAVATLGLTGIGLLTRFLSAANPTQFDVFFGLLLLISGTICLSVILYAHNKTRRLKEDQLFTLTDTISSTLLCLSAALAIVSVAEIVLYLQ